MSLKYWQKDHKDSNDIELCEADNSEPFAWTDINADKILSIEFFSDKECKNKMNPVKEDKSSEIGRSTV